MLPVQAVGDGTGVRPIYEVATATKGLPFLQPQPEPFMRHITAKECCGHPPVTFNRVEKVREENSRGSKWICLYASSARGLFQHHWVCIRRCAGHALPQSAQPRASKVCQPSPLFQLRAPLSIPYTPLTPPCPGGPLLCRVKWLTLWEHVSA